MISISVCMIVKNEEDVLARCLDCAKQIADEIIIVDTGSSDTTKQIAKEYTDNVYDFSWCEDFSKARNYSFSKATKDYCMWLDADDIILDEDIRKFQALKQSMNGTEDIVMMKYHTGFDEQGIPVFSYYRERLIKNDRTHVWEGVIHEVISLRGNIRYEEIAITHRKVHVADPKRNIRIFENLIAQGVALSPREQFYYARELYYHQRYEDSYAMFETFLKGKQGWIENIIDACQMMGYCAYFMGQEEHALECFFKSFLYDTPRAELCCDIGKHFFDREHYKQAIFWYECALTAKRNDHSGAFVRGDCYGYIPSLQLCVCWWRLGDKDKAKEYNEKAGQYKPASKEVEKNRELFL
ncbi:tetratricopeptide repeat-containing glycosyltransferase family 2 protein [Amedibacillus sp. YH-ame10]